MLKTRYMLYQQEHIFHFPPMREYDCVYVLNNCCDTRMRPIFSQLITHYFEFPIIPMGNNISNIMSPMRDPFLLDIYMEVHFPGPVLQMQNQPLMDINLCWWNMII